MWKETGKKKKKQIIGSTYPVMNYEHLYLFLVIHFTAVTASQIIQRWMVGQLINNELERILKEGVVA
jgi:hypothetical protein